MVPTSWIKEVFKFYKSQGRFKKKKVWSATTHYRRNFSSNNKQELIAKSLWEHEQAWWLWWGERGLMWERLGGELTAHVHKLSCGMDGGKASWLWSHLLRREMKRRTSVGWNWEIYLGHVSPAGISGRAGRYKWGLREDVWATRECESHSLIHSV